MMKSFLFVLMLSGSTFALEAEAFAQLPPNTTETDQSEEDWRKSQKKGGNSAEDILDIIKNTRSSGVGNGRGYSPIDALPEESRRHLMKERAKRMAQAGPNEPVDVTYKPSEAAISDSDLETDEKAAWEEMSKGINGATDQGQQGQSQGQNQQGGQQVQQGQQGSAPGSKGQQQGGGLSSKDSGQSGQSKSVMRGGSANSVSDIMARIKGLSPKSGGAGLSQGHQSNQGQQSLSNSGQSNQGQSSQGQGRQTGQSQQDGQQQNLAQSDAQAKAEATNQAHSTAHSQNKSQSQSSVRTPEAVSPLDRIKEMNREQKTSGTRSSASDYLKKKN